ncbi:MAG: hypothetical protein J0I32_16335 [Sphingobacteriales bacterium]|nr:hypothetical protein [Sphingobacteriales bacterium]OJV99618.1 MAG: hypothetical protein BGO52_13345 [Sphingobacteriales bacterium 44-61]
MKQILYLAFGLIVLLSVSSCKKGDSSNPSLILNTWKIDVDNTSEKSSFTFSQVSGTLSTQGYQLLDMHGDDVVNPAINHCRLQIFFNTIGPPPSGTYTVTSYENLANMQNGAAIIVTRNDYVVHKADENQSINVIFANGTLEVKFNNINITREGQGWTNKYAKLSASLRK